MRQFIASLNVPELLFLGAIVITPITLFLDYRTGLSPVRRPVFYLPIGEDNGRPVSYRQLFGLTQVVWLIAGTAALAIPGWRGVLRRSTVLPLGLLIVLLVAETAARGQIDSATALDLLATVAPLAAIAAVASHPAVRLETRRHIVLVAAAWAALTVLATVAKKTGAGLIHQRLDTFAFGTAPDTGEALAPFALLAAAGSGLSIGRRAAIAGVLTVGVLLTQTRGAVLALVAGLIVVALVRRRLRGVGAGVAALAGTAFVVLSARSLTFSDTATHFRRENLLQHWHLFRHRPIFGYGISGSSLGHLSAAHNSFLGLGIAGGLLAVALWIAAWLRPTWKAARAARQSTFAAFALGAIVATVVGWVTTGADIVVYAQPTNLLPLVLASSFFVDATTQDGMRPVRSKATRRVLAAGAIAALVCAGSAIAINIGGRPTHARSVRAEVAALGMAFSTCGSCSLTVPVGVGDGIWESRINSQRAPGGCLIVAPSAYRARPPGQLPPGINWQSCTKTRGALLQPPEGLISTANPRGRVEARSDAEAVARLSVCTPTCRITSVTYVAAGIWGARLNDFHAQPSDCFYLFPRQFRITSDQRLPSGVIWIACARGA